MKPSTSLLFFFCILSLQGKSQVIKRWSEGKKEFEGKKLTAEKKDNIFEDFDWSKPDISSRKLDFNDKVCSFEWGNESYVLRKLSDDKMILESTEIDQTSSKDLSEGKMYYNKTILPLKAVSRNRWVSYTAFEMRSVPVMRTRQVTSYQYNSSTGTTTPVSRTENYTTYEQRSVPTTKWRWQTYTTYVIDIPNYHYFSFTLPDQSHIIIYEVEENSKTSYYLQNISYISAIDEENINYLMIDKNSNGSYLDLDDKVMFNSWNPYSEKSTFKRIPFFQANNWYDLDFLKKRNFLSFNVTEDQLEILYANDKYSDSKEKGSVTFTNIPKGAVLFVNGNKFKLKSKNKTFKNEYGIFRATISLENHLDFEQVYTIDENTADLTIQYQPTFPAGVLNIKNIYATDYHVTVKSEKYDYSKTVYNTNSIAVPDGKIMVTINTDGHELQKSLLMFAGLPSEIFYDELVKELEDIEVDPGEVEEK